MSLLWFHETWILSFIQHDRWGVFLHGLHSRWVQGIYVCVCAWRGWGWEGILRVGGSSLWSINIRPSGRGRFKYSINPLASCDSLMDGVRLMRYIWWIPLYLAVKGLIFVSWRKRGRGGGGSHVWCKPLVNPCQNTAIFFSVLLFMCTFSFSFLFFCFFSYFLPNCRFIPLEIHNAWLRGWKDISKANGKIQSM